MNRQKEDERTIAVLLSVGTRQSESRKTRKLRGEQDPGVRNGVTCRRPSTPPITNRADNEERQNALSSNIMKFDSYYHTSEIFERKDNNKNNTKENESRENRNNNKNKNKKKKKNNNKNKNKEQELQQKEGPEAGKQKQEEQERREEL
ncbi:hypothetical protein M514_12916 [Trichuris suis]|uniref:Uncharacterized protein n=1 Tax=Trichuris suis TaxID=68888 RepID=A0A085MSP9_9BILA|nr:hypothetical protein M514_12916 [Trichuris suis]